MQEITFDIVSMGTPTLSLKQRMRLRNAPHWGRDVGHAGCKRDD
jgi:hypothetical protein